MLSFKQHQRLEEALVTFGGRAYPKFGNIVILQGGAGSGKGFVKSNLLGIEGWNFDVDELKKMAMNSTILSGRVLKDTGVDITKLDLKNPENVSKIHTILSDLYQVDKRFKQKEFAALSTAHPDRKPNLIFDVTGKSLKHFNTVREIADTYGYDPKNIHAVWILDDVKAAVEKNRNRDRVVPEDILVQTHEGASLTAKKLLSMGADIKKYLDGDYWIVFNKMKVDTDNVTSDKGGFYIKDANYFKLKEKGKSLGSIKNINKAIYDKIKSYVPKVDDWS